MTYKVKEIFYTLQGEGRHAGRPAVFCRFSLCNLWTGREQERARAICQFCDTDFVGTDGPGGGRFTDPDTLADAISAAWPAPPRSSDPVDDIDIRRPLPMVVFTGGEPLLQLDAPAVQAVKARGFYVAVETNGTRTPPPGIDWLCVSPKVGADLTVTSGDELKFVYPQHDVDPAVFEELEFTSLRLQPMDGPDVADNTKLAVQYCLDHPRWHLSLQTHKYLGIP